MWVKNSLQHAVHIQFPWSSRWNHQLLDFIRLSLHDNKVEWCNCMCKPARRNIKWKQDGVLLLRLDPAPWWYRIQQDKTTAHPNYFELMDQSIKRDCLKEGRDEEGELEGNGEDGKNSCWGSKTLLLCNLSFLFYLSPSPFPRVASCSPHENVPSSVLLHCIFAKVRGKSITQIHEVVIFIVHNAQAILCLNESMWIQRTYFALFPIWGFHENCPWSRHIGSLNSDL